MSLWLYNISILYENGIHEEVSGKRTIIYTSDKIYCTKFLGYVSHSQIMC